MVQVIRKTDAKAWARLASLGKKLDKTELQVGWFSTMHYKNGASVAHVATIHEFGAPKQGIPPRPFMRPTIAREEGNWRRLIAQEAPKILAGTQTVNGLFKALGLNVSGQIGKTIAELTTPALLEATILARVRKMADMGTVGSLDKPLVETSQMIDSVTYVVKETP